ncbi:hypothetical protein DPMN_123868 [Dreissena polymorpha]|uniref:Uncharacterized protein n=1 Tax=Dreissena polymorpha TaxID=45954 RepID=A0A9D4JVR0_DREPO|nr:hypothetical protein DPMN_123868 [Dreissena polymorpha]
MAKKGKGRGKKCTNTIEEENAESPPKGATPPPKKIKMWNSIVGDSKTCGATGEGTVTLTGDSVTDAVTDEPNTSSRSKRVIEDSDSVFDDGADNELQGPSQPNNKKASS